MARRPVNSRPETLARRREILDAAVEIFGRKGYANGSLQEIADQVGMTHAGVLHHFGSKHQLLLAVLVHRDETDVADLVDHHIPDGMALFRHLVRTALFNATRPGIVQAFTVLSSEATTQDNPGRPFFEERYVNLRADVTKAFGTVCAERGITAPATIDAAAASILAVMDGLQVQWLLDPDAVDLARASAFAIESIVRGVLGPDTDVLGDDT